MDETELRETFGPNDWLIDEMYRQYVQDPNSVAPSWRDFFADYRPNGGRGAVAAAPPAAEPAPSREAPAEPRRPEVPEGATPLRGGAAVIASNMQASLGVPTATSARVVPAKLLEENRRVVNDLLASRRGGKVSFTHVVGYAILRAAKAIAAMNASFVDVDGKPHVVRHEHVNLGLAVDVQRADGSRTLLVPNIKQADTLDFAAFWNAYEDVIRRVRAGKMSPDDFAGTTMTLTNPGTIGTVLSVPRLMQGQGVIVGTGAIDYPVEYEGADPATLAALGVGKVMTVTSTYDHRIIQGAESGEFLARIDALLKGEDGFYEDIFASLGVPYEPVRWSRDRGSALATHAADPFVEKNARVLQLINMFRVRGHLLADLNPLSSEVRHHVELDPGHYDLGVWDLDREFFVAGLAGQERMTLRRALDLLRDAYCRTVGIEYMHIQEADQKQWIQERVEGVPRSPGREDMIHLLEQLNAAEAFERFLHTKYVGHKRFGLEGSESLIPMLDRVLELAADTGMTETVIGMAHRGRLNVLANVVGKSYAKIFLEFEGNIDPQSAQGSGDVKYHLGATGKRHSRQGNEIIVSVASNPSHLEAVDPVVEGIVRARQDLVGDAGVDVVLPLLIHGDAAFAGQGVVAETLNLSQLSGYRTGGTVHIVVNNGIGFTTTPEDARSSVYATDVAKMVQAPIFHVNGDDPEACVWVVALAFAFRQAFHKDVVVDIVCYRRYGHNEADEPAYTQPLMYAEIEAHRSVRKLYTEKLVNRGDITLDEAEALLDDFRRRLDQAFQETHASQPPALTPSTRGPRPSGVRPPIETGVGRMSLETIVEAFTTFPEGFEPHPKLARQLTRRTEQFASDQIDWAFGEALAFGSLLMEGTWVRLSGQDSSRGTFSQRHVVLVDHRTAAEYTPLAHVPDADGRFMVYDSLLSEYAALGFEYGYAVGNRDALVLWEAQFGDFMNGAQIVIDQYIVSSEDKWGQTCGVVLLLPHGYEGQGPEHSSARIERFLMLCADDNIQVCYPTLPAQYFHLLRRQVRSAERKPLVVLTPKSLLRHPVARSALADFERGHFLEVLPDPAGPDPTRVRRVLACTGKMYVDLAKRRDESKRDDVAIVRLEQLYPFPHVLLDEQLYRYPNAERVIWVQEEPENMGAWTFVFAKTRHQIPNLEVIARAESPAPATGSATRHQQEQEALVEEAFE